jgi:Tfp pilus assembly protein PilF
MKKIWSLCLILTLTIVLSACGKDKPKETKEEQCSAAYQAYIQYALDHPDASIADYTKQLHELKFKVASDFTQDEAVLIVTTYMKHEEYESGDDFNYYDDQLTILKNYYGIFLNGESKDTAKCVFIEEEE